MLTGKTVILGVTGSIAAYKAADLVSLLVKRNCQVHVIMTRNACNFINPITFETLTSNKCLVETFDRDHEYDVRHISLARKADMVLIAPATADVIGKLASGIADDMLTTTVMATKAPVYIAPAMNSGMYANPILKDNIEKLKQFGYRFIEPASGHLACGDEGEGKLPPVELLLEYIFREIAFEKDMKGMKVLVTAGPTQEPIDPVRYITNHSSGKMGYAIAKAAMLRGAEVTLITGLSPLDPPPFMEVVNILTARDMYDEVTARFRGMDMIIKAAAVADYRPAKFSEEKIKKSDADTSSIPLTRTDDILRYIGSHASPRQVICGFSMETEDMLKNSEKKLVSKHADMIAANNLKMKDSGFQGDNNTLTLISDSGVEVLQTMTKFQSSVILLDRLMDIYRRKNG